MVSAAMKIAIGSDHAGFELKQILLHVLKKHKTITVDVGTYDTASVDYTDFGYKVADKIIKGEAELGIIICGTGIGISIAANRNPKIRAALCHNEYTAKMAREHNDANILALGARVVDKETAKKCLNAFLTSSFEGGRHKKRVDKLSNYPG